MPDNKKRLMLIMNPVAGKGSSKKNIANILQILEEGGYIVTSFVTEKHNDAVDYIVQYGAGFDTIVCCGGDGTMSETITGIIRAGLHTPLGYIPTGSMNDFAAYHEISHDMEKAARTIVKGDIRYVDVISFNHYNYSINASEFGIFTWISYNTPQKSKNLFGGLAYFLQGIKDLNKLKSQHLKVTANGNVYEGNYLFGILCNSTRIVGTLTKRDKIIQADDGIMEVGLARKPSSMFELQRMIQTILSGDLNHKDLSFFKAKKIIVETDEPLDWSMDGEHYISPTYCEIENLHNRITLIC